MRAELVASTPEPWFYHEKLYSVNGYFCNSNTVLEFVSKHNCS